MLPLIVLENPSRWPFDIPGVEVVPARSYLVDPRFSELRRAAVFNLCRHYRHQGLGYYVSLLAAARGHRPLPSVETVQALRSSTVLRIVSDDLDDLIQHTLAPLKSSEFELSVYFGRNLAKRYDRLSQALFNQFPVPFLRAGFTLEGKRWELTRIRAVAAGDIPDPHHDFVISRATEYLARPRRVHAPPRYRYDLAILFEDSDDAPSDERAIRKFVRAGRKVGIESWVIGSDDYGRIAEFDALFIRETTAVNHFTYRFSQRAAREGLVVIDDPESIIRCTNKVYQAEMFERYDIPSPRTLVVHEGNVDEVEPSVGLPCVLKRPDSSFSAGVVRVSNQDELKSRLADFFEQSDLVVAQEFMPSAFDWRVGVLNGRAFYACKYHMAKGHWQIIARDSESDKYGRVEAVALEAVPTRVRDVAVSAASHIGDGLYGIDVKEVHGRHVVMEINDNPSIEAGYEDGVVKDDLYLDVMKLFRDRLDARGRKPG